MNYKKALEAYKSLAQQKKNTLEHIFQRAIIISMHARTDRDEQISIAISILKKACPPVRKRSKLENGSTPYQAILSLRGWNNSPYVLRKDSLLLGVKIEEIFGEDTIENLSREIFNEIAARLDESAFNTWYSYIFLKPGLIPEQCVVQSAHIAMKMGQKLVEAKAWPKGVTSDNLHYCIVKCESFERLDYICRENGVKIEEFYDHNYGFDDSGKLHESQEQYLQAVMTYPIDWRKKHLFNHYKLLRFGARMA